MTDSWCCYVGTEEELHVLVLCFTGFLLGLGFKGTYCYVQNISQVYTNCFHSIGYFMLQIQ